MQINKPTFRISQVGRLMGISLVAVFLWNSTIAQENVRDELGAKPAEELVAEHSPGKHTNAISPGLSMFFIVGIVINVVVVAWFTAWFIREWNRKKRDLE